MEYLKELIKKRPVFGTGVFTLSALDIEIYASCGIDFLFIDAEHTPLTVPDCREAIVTCLANGVHPLMRVPSCDPVDIRKAYEMGIEGVMVPHIRTKKDMEDFVAAAKFPIFPGGKRSYDSNVRAAKYGGRGYDPLTYIDEVQRSQIIIAVCEDIEFVENIDEIFSVEGIDAVTFGPFDFGMSEKREDFYKVDWERPDLKEAYRIVTTKALEKGIEVCMPPIAPLDVEHVKEAVDKGYRMINLSFDTFCVQGKANELKTNIIDRF